MWRVFVTYLVAVGRDSGTVAGEAAVRVGGVQAVRAGPAAVARVSLHILFAVALSGFVTRSCRAARVATAIFKQLDNGFCIVQKYSSKIKYFKNY